MEPIHESLFKKHDECSNRLYSLETRTAVVEHQIKAQEVRMDRFLMESERSRAEILAKFDKNDDKLETILQEIHTRVGRDRFASYLTPVAVSICGILIAYANYLGG